MKEWRTPEGDALRLYLDILRQPHTLIAGTTGSGKSVLLNGIIYTALYKAPPQMQFILLDPKRVELKIYKDLPHTLRYCTETDEATQVLNTLITEMMSRYDRMSEKNLKQSTETPLYIVIDELNDLVTEAPPITKQLGRIAKLGRAANIHLIGATQNPNRKTLSADFLGNCPARIALRCDDPIESRQIIKRPDAVNLPAHGYALYKSPQIIGAPQLVRIPYYDDEALAERVRWWTDQKAQPRRRWWQR